MYKGGQNTTWMDSKPAGWVHNYNTWFFPSGKFFFFNKKKKKKKKKLCQWLTWIRWPYPPPPNETKCQIFKFRDPPPPPPPPLSDFSAAESLRFFFWTPSPPPPKKSVLFPPPPPWKNPAYATASHTIWKCFVESISVLVGLSGLHAYHLFFRIINSFLPCKPV